MNYQRQPPSHTHGQCDPALKRNNHKKPSTRSSENCCVFHRSSFDRVNLAGCLQNVGWIGLWHALPFDNESISMHKKRCSLKRPTKRGALTCACGIYIHRYNVYWVNAKRPGVATFCCQTNNGVYTLCARRKTKNQTIIKYHRQTDAFIFVLAWRYSLIFLCKCILASHDVLSVA